MRGLPEMFGGVSRQRFPSINLEALDPRTVQAFFLISFVFVMALLLALSRRYIISNSLQGVWAGLVAGVISVLVIQGLIFWSIKDFLSGEKITYLPANVRIAIDTGRENLSSVLGIRTEKTRPSAQSVVSDYGLLSPLDSQLVENTICKEK